jgi:UDP-N-acetylmuramate--alanine ligase
VSELPRRVHFVGIGGIGMSALAKVLQEEGYQVSGSDLKLTPLVRRLAARGAVLYEGHAPEHVQGAELVVTTAALPPGHPEVEAARTAGIPVISRAALLGRLMAHRRGIAVAGTHGKTTTSAMIVHLLVASGHDPTFLVGGEIRTLETNARRGSDEWLVAEADEYDRSFLHLWPEIAVLTNVEADHLDIYADLTAVQQAFCQFARQVTGTLVLCADDPFLAGGGLGDLTRPVVSYGLTAGEWQARDIRLEGAGSRSLVYRAGHLLGELRLALPGRHNIQNALGALAAVSLIGVGGEATLAALAHFRGTRRRQEVVGEAGGVLVIDDYGHHPTEIRATLSALRAAYSDRRLVCLFQPHTYSRTKLLLAEFATCFAAAEVVRVAEIYPARERDEWGITAADLVRALDHPDARSVGEVEEAAVAVAAELRPGDLLVIMGAGDITRAGPLVLARLGEHGAAG